MIYTPTDLWGRPAETERHSLIEPIRRHDRGNHLEPALSATPAPGEPTETAQRTGGPMRHVSLGVVLLALSGCGGSGSQPSGPAQVAGVYRGTLTPTSVTGGECVGAILQSQVGRPQAFTASVQQDGSALTATITSDATGTNCTY